MTIDWTLLTYYVVAVFAISGFLRGWWKETFTTAILAGFVFLLQSPDLAQTLIDTINVVFATVWSYIPTNLIPIVDRYGVETGVAVTTTTDPPPILVDPSSAGTWISMLLIAMTFSILVGRSSLSNRPTGIGQLLGGALGVFNAFLALGLVREYLDGRALPGARQVADSDIVLAGSSGFGTPTSDVTIQATGLPTITILDSMLPWIIIGIGVLLLFTFLKTRISSDGQKVVYNVPPFHS